MSRKLNVITCPKCGREYMPAEIFIPKNLLGAPSVIKRNADGKIEDFICCDKWIDKNPVKKIAINYCPDLMADSELYRINPGCSIVVL